MSESHTTDDFELSANAAVEDHKAARAAQAIAECIALPDIETVELEALQAMITAELQDRDYNQMPMDEY